MDVINFAVTSRNPYNALLYRHADPRYRMRPGTIDDACHAVANGESRLFHLHWEEQLFMHCEREADAAAAIAAFEERLGAFLGAGGRLVWTVHNALPHEGRHVALFIGLRRRLAERASLILVHHEVGAQTLAGQCAVDRSKFAVLPHPAYFGAYEDEAATLALEPDWDARRLAFIGMLRPYKGLDLLARAARLVPEVAIDVAGEPGFTFAADLQPLLDDVPTITLEPRRLDDGELPERLRATRGLVLPYRSILTSGAILLAMTFGRPVVAPDLRQIRSLLPASVHRLLYRPGDAGSLATRMLALATLSRAEQEALRADLQLRARRYRPERISEQLFRLFDVVLR